MAAARDRYSEWIARGRAHQGAGRPIDALLCYRQALRVTRGADAQFHIGEVVWRLGRHAEAVAAWRAATEIAPTHAASWQALADACAVGGDFVAAEHAAQQVLRLMPADARAGSLRVLLDALAHQASDATLAGAIEAGNGWPLALLAAIVERIFASPRHRELPQAVPRLLAATSGALVVQGNEDALRRVAVALSRAGIVDEAQAYADRYAHACRALHRETMPLRWPLRTAGPALRVGLLTASSGIRDAVALRAAIAQAEPPSDVHWTALIMDSDGPAADAAPWEGDLKALPVAAHAAALAAAALDLDVLIDVAGAGLASGPFLVLHPARALWAVERRPVPSNRELADRVFSPAGDDDVGALAAALRDHCASVRTLATSELGAKPLSALWDAAVRAHQLGDLGAADSGYSRFLDAQPGYAPAAYLRGALWRSDNDRLRAREGFRAAVEAAPRYVDARVALIASLVDAGETEQAVRIANEGLAQDATPAALWRALANAQLRAGDASGAVTSFEEALQRDATDGEAHYNHGVALQTAHRSADAARAYQRALTFSPELHAADFNLGVIFEQQGNVAGAIAAFSKVIERVPGHAGAYKALAETLLADGRIDLWMSNFDRFERHCAGHLALAAHALEVCAYRADFAALERYLDGLRHGRYTAGTPDETLDALQQLLYLLHFFDVEPELIARYARTHDALARTMYGEPLPRAAVRREGRLRIGYLSGDFRNHVMGKMMWEALSRHDRTRFDVRGYATSDVRDAWTPRFEAAFSSLESLGALSDRAAAQRIAAADLDVLVDLSTHTKGARPGILALKPARVQITHIASAGTLAMSAIDFKLTDRYADITQDPALQIEAPLVMNGCVYPYRHIAPVDDQLFRREALGIARDAVVIAAFCTPQKLSQRCLGLWREVMESVPSAVLAFSPAHPALRKVFQRIASVAGIASRRLVFVPQGRDDAENQARYRLVDFVLDPMPYGGVNGTLEALDMQVPVVTLVGRRHAERTSYSILENLGVTQTLAQSGGEYVAIARRLATDAGFMREVRERIGLGLRGSALTDMTAHARNLERAYVEALAAQASEALAGALA